MSKYENLPQEMADVNGCSNENLVITAEGNPRRPVYVLTDQCGVRKGLRAPGFDFGYEKWLRDGTILTARRCLRALGRPLPDEVPDHDGKLLIYSEWYERQFTTKPLLVKWDGRTVWEMLVELDPDSACAKGIRRSQGLE